MVKCTAVLFGILLMAGLVQSKVLKKRFIAINDNQTGNLSSNEDVAAEEESMACSEPGFCSPWVFCKKDECVCGEIPNIVAQCNTHGDLSIMENICITYNSDDSLVELGRCIYTGTQGIRTVNTKLPHTLSELNDFVCGNTSNRAGTLCGGCKDGYYPRVYSFDVKCVKCSEGNSNWWKYVLAAYLPLTTFCFAVLFFRINVTSSQLFAFVFYCQIIAMPMMACILSNYTSKALKTSAVIKVLAVFYGIWNLDFFRSLDLGICLGTGSLQTLALDIAVGVYPLLLMIPTYLLIGLYDRNFTPIVLVWKPFKSLFIFFSRGIQTRTSLIDAFATFFLLSNVKLLCSSLDLLAPVTVYQLNTTGHFSSSVRLYNDATIEYFGRKHLPYAILAITVLSLFAVLPTLLLIIYPFRWFQKLLNLFPIRWHILHTFVDSFHGCYKDGTEPGTRDCRWFASVLFLTRYVLMLIGASTFNHAYLPLATMVLVIVALMFLVAQPFKEHVAHFTCITVMFLLFLGLAYICAIGWDRKYRYQQVFYLVLSVAVGLFPLLYIAAISLHWICSNWIFETALIRRLKAWRCGYELLKQ